MSPPTIYPDPHPDDEFETTTDTEIRPFKVDDDSEVDLPELAPVQRPQAPPAEDPAPLYRGATSDPLFGFIVAVAVSIGMTPLPAEHADLRYTVAWLALAIVGVLGWLLGSSERIGQEKPENIAWGIGFGLLLGLPVLAFGADLMHRSSLLLFPTMMPGTLLAYLIFVTPLAETLFFRGVAQQYYDFWVVGLWSTAWSVLLFFPAMWGDILASPAVAVVIAVAFLMMNMMYSYVKERNGLAAAWLCQIVVNILVLFVPFILVMD